MRITVLGGGPAGLYSATLLKRDNPSATLTVFEQNPKNVTWGFGVVFSDKALSFLEADDPETFAAFAGQLETWRDITIDLMGEETAIDGVGFAAIARLKLIQILTRRAEEIGVTIKFDSAPTDYEEEAGASDLVIAADGVNSLIRNAAPESFGARVENLSNRFVWYGTTKTFPTLTQTFRRSEWGAFNAHHYRYAPDMSTFIVETTEEVWREAGLDQADDAESRRICESVFADVLDGHALISNKSIWRVFPKVWNDNWYAGNKVLIGDALHTAHFSIGSGTRLAMEDAISLAKAVRDNPGNLQAALKSYQDDRKPIVAKLVGAAEESANWYEHFISHMDLPPFDFAHSYIKRAGRLDDDRLRAIAPKFMAQYDAAKQAATELGAA